MAGLLLVEVKRKQRKSVGKLLEWNLTIQSLFVQGNLEEEKEKVQVGCAPERKKNRKGWRNWLRIHRKERERRGAKAVSPQHHQSSSNSGFFLL